jgi:hypothetical protein
LMPMNPEGMSKAMEGLPDQAKNIVTAMQQNVQQLTQQLQQAQMELKYKGGIAQMQEQAETQRHQMTETTKRADILTESQVKREDTHTKAHTAIAVAEIGAAGKILDTHAGAAHDIELAKHTLKKGESTD